MSKNREITAREREVLDRLAVVLQKAGTSWAAAAKIAGRSEALGAQWSGRRSFPREEALYRIAQHLGVAMGWLLTGDEPSAETLAMTETERAMLKALRELAPDAQRAAVAQITALATNLTKK
jgi:transcriptional regulator with XRE-family HTH domain